jgi:nicotinamidase/pyrazinamidase
MNQKRSALLIVDVQHDFLPGGSLGVKDGDRIISVINKLQQQFDRIIATQDFHPANHKSFASNHAGKQVGEFIELGGQQQILWPDHCVQNTEGTKFSEELEQSKWEKIFQKGMNAEVDSYSGFFDNAKMGDTGLNDYLKKEEISRLYITGLAQDYCVKFTALDGVNLGFETYLIADATRPVNLSAVDGDQAIQELKTAGVKIIESKELL